MTSNLVKPYLTLNKTTLLGVFIISVIDGSCLECGEFEAFGESKTENK